MIPMLCGSSSAHLGLNMRLTRVIGSDSPETALENLRHLTVHNDSAAVLLPDHIMQQWNSVEKEVERTACCWHLDKWAISRLVESDSD